MTDEPTETSAPGASCTIYRSAPSWNGRRTAAIGAFRCDSADAGASLLRDSIDGLRDEGYEAVIGPMDGDTWHKYRLVSETDGSTPFFLEPVSGPHDLEAFVTAGLSPISSYVSARAYLADREDDMPEPIPSVTLRQWDGENAEGLFGSLFDLSREAFAENAFYKPISRDAFLALYQPILPAIDPRLILFAYTDAGDLVGYLFAIPDRLQGPQSTTAIIKTYASRRRGVGRLLVDATNRTLRDLGYQDVIHALMHVDNQSRSRSALNHGTIFRRYDLMGLDLLARPG